MTNLFLLPSYLTVNIVDIYILDTVLVVGPVLPSLPRTNDIPEYDVARLHRSRFHLTWHYPIST